MLSDEIETAHSALCKAVEDAIKIIEGEQKGQLKDPNVEEWLKDWRSVTKRLGDVSGQPADIYTDIVGTAILRVDVKAEELDINGQLTGTLEVAWEEIKACHKTWMRAHVNADHDDETSSPPTSDGGTSTVTLQ